jgi:hypothetical protein
MLPGSLLSSTKFLPQKAHFPPCLSQALSWMPLGNGIDMIPISFLARCKMKRKIQNGWLDNGDALWAHYENGNHTGLTIRAADQPPIIYHAHFHPRFYPQSKTIKDVHLFSSPRLKEAKQRAEKLLPELRKACLNAT